MCCVNFISLTINNMDYKILVVLFILLVLVYIVINKKKINNVDTILLLISIAALTWRSVIDTKVYEGNIEGFADGTNAKSLAELVASFETIKQDEDISEIQNSLVMYFTAFHKLSYNNPTKQWASLIQATNQTDSKCTSNLSFDVVPTFNKTNGFSLGSNGLKGPFSNNLNISFRNPYTIMLVFKNGKLYNESSIASGIELLKLFANSPNNNGLSLYFEPGSLITQDTTEFGKLMLQFADNEPVQLKIDPTNKLIKIDTNILCFIFIVRYDDSIRVIYMNETSNTTYELAKFNISNTEVTFSNKEVLINGRKNWNARIYNVGVWNNALSDVYINNIYQHILSLHNKFNSPSYTAMLSTYNEAAEQLSLLTKCPFDQPTCKSCKSVGLWTDVTQVLYAPLSCRQAVSKYCSNNPTQPMCECWDPKQEVYNTSACKVLRDAFEEDEQNLCKKISNKDLECIKLKYQLVEKATVEDQTKNKYDDAYTFEKVRVKYNEDGLTTEEKKRMKMATADPKTMKVIDSHKEKCPLPDNKNDNKESKTVINKKSDDAFAGLDADDVKFLNDINKPPQTTGFWDTFSRLLFG